MDCSVPVEDEIMDVSSFVSCFITTLLVLKILVYICSGLGLPSLILPCFLLYRSSFWETELRSMEKLVTLEMRSLLAGKRTQFQWPLISLFQKGTYTVYHFLKYLCDLQIFEIPYKEISEEKQFAWLHSGCGKQYCGIWIEVFPG